MSSHNPAWRIFPPTLVASLLLSLWLSVTLLAQRPELVPQIGHGDVVDNALFSHDGKLLATSGGYTVKLWSPKTGRMLRTLQPGTLVPTMAFSPDDKVLAIGEGMGADVEGLSMDDPRRAGGEGYQIQFWDTRTGKLLRKVGGHSFWMSDLEYSPDGKWMASSGSEGEVLLRDGDGVVIAKLHGKVNADKAVWPRLAFSHNSKLLAIVDDKSDLELWDVATHTRIKDFGPDSAGALKSSFTPEDDAIAALVPSGEGEQRSSTLTYWEVESGKKTEAIKGIQGGAVISHDWNWLAVSVKDGKDRKINFYNLAHDSQLEASIYGYGIMAFSPDDTEFASWNPFVQTNSAFGSAEGNGSPEVVVWDVKNSRVLQRLPKFGLEDAGTEVTGYSIALGGGGELLARRIAGMTGGETMTVWDLASSSGPTLMRVPQAANATMAFSEKQRWFALSVHGGVVTSEIDTDANAKVYEVPKDDDSSMADVLAISPDEHYIARTALNGKADLLTIWDRGTGAVALAQKGVRGFAWFADSKTFVAADEEGNISIRRVDGGAIVKDLGKHPKLNAVAVSPDQTQVASGADDGTLRIWDAGTGTQIAAFSEADCQSPGNSPGSTVIKVSRDCVSTLQFSPDGRYLAGSGTDAGAPLFVWETRSWKLLYSLRSKLGIGSIDSKFPFVFTRDSRFIAEGTRFITFWDLQTGQEAATLAASANGDWLVITPEGYFDGSPGGWKAVAWRFGGDTFDVLPLEAFYTDFYQPGLLNAILQGKISRSGPAIADRDRRQPKVTFLGAEKSKSAGPETSSVMIGFCEAAPDAQHAKASGVRDLRLFRNGILVRHWHGEMQDLQKGCGTVSADVELLKGENRLTAYAFNDSDIKSEDAETYVEASGNGAQKGTAYIITVGVNKYATPGMDLRYAGDDATAFADTLASQSNLAQDVGNVVEVKLLDAEATRANIRAALEVLGGTNPSLTPAQKPLLAKLQKARPQDAIFFFYAGHGTAVGNHFFLLPHDARPEALDRDIEHASVISETELGNLFEGIDGGHFVVVIDACRSGQALEAEEKRQGAMNSKGLAQLAYEKGMYVLTASQAYQAALETSQYGHGLLTYALLDLIKKPAGGERLYVFDWLEQAAETVPMLQRGAGTGRGTSPLVSPARGNEVQRPRLFSRRDPDPDPLLILAPAAAQK